MDEDIGGGKMYTQRPAGMHWKKLELDDNSKAGMEEIQEMLRRETKMI